MSQTDKKPKYRDIGDDIPEEDEEKLDRAWAAAFAEREKMDPVEREKLEKEEEEIMNNVTVPEKLW